MKRTLGTGTWILALCAALAACSGADAPTEGVAGPVQGGGETASEPLDHPGQIEQWRKRRMASLTSDSGWLTVVGLHWLEAGGQTFGSDPGNRIVIAAAGVPPVAGSLILEGGEIRLAPVEGAGLLVGDEAVTEARVLATDESGKPDVIGMGDVRAYVIKRGDRLALRVKDPNSSARRNFAGIDYFPISREYRIEADFVPYDTMKKIGVPTVLGTTEPMDVPGYVRFELQGKELTLEPVVDGPDDDSYFFIFKDETSRSETYPAGRFLYTDTARDGRVTLDFNKAYNPPCAFTDFATCPLPPKQNVLAVRIEAGEKNASIH